MNKKVKVYFDFLCPFCFKVVLTLQDLIQDFPGLTIDWEPCEAHPRPEVRDQYSDIACEAFLYVKGHRGDVDAFLKAVYYAYYIKKQRIDDKDVLVQCAQSSGIDGARLKASLVRRDYKQDVMSSNNDIWQIFGAEAVPALYCRNNRLVSKENHLLSKDELRAFLASL